MSALALPSEATWNRFITDAKEAPLRVRQLSPLELSPAEIARWQQLSQTSLEPNPFLSPEFVIPSIEVLRTRVPVVLLVIDDSSTGEWKGAGVFEVARSLPYRPIRYAQGLTSCHSYLDGLLLSPVNPKGTVISLFKDQSQHRHWHGFHFESIRVGSPLAAILQTSASITGINVCHSRIWQRAQFKCEGPMTVESIVGNCSKSRRKSLMRGRRRLAAKGRLDFRLTVPDAGTAPCVNGFLELEKMGWKGVQGTAFACHPKSEQFFRQLAESCGQSRSMVFGELFLNGELIASTCNLLSGTAMSAFKIGWNPEYGDCGIGYWSEIELAAAVTHLYPEIRYIDSSSKVGSYLESIWLDRQSMRSMTFSWSQRGRMLQSARECCRWLARGFYSAELEPAI